MFAVRETDNTTATRGGCIATADGTGLDSVARCIAQLINLPPQGFEQLNATLVERGEYLRLDHIQLTDAACSFWEIKKQKGKWA